MPVVISVFKTLLVVVIVVFGWAFFVSWFGVNNRDRYKTCPICGKNMSSTLEICKACEYDPVN